MSKGSLFFDKARGKVGNVVLSVLNGQQIARAYNETNASKGNGATGSQREQRLHILNLINLYRVLKRSEILAFTNKSAQNSYYNAFFKANLATAGVYLTKAEFDRGACVAAPVVVAQGPLSPCNAFTDSVELGFATKAFTWPTTATMGDWYKALIEQNLGFQEGDMITIAKIAQTDDPTISVSYDQLVIDPNDTTAATAELKEKFPNISVGSQVVIAILGDEPDAIAAIHTRKTGAKVEASYAKIHVLSNDAYTTYTSAQQRAKARDSYGYKSLPMLDPSSKAF